MEVHSKIGIILGGTPTIFLCNGAFFAKSRFPFEGETYKAWLLVSFCRWRGTFEMLPYTTNPNKHLLSNCQAAVEQVCQATVEHCRATVEQPSSNGWANFFLLGQCPLSVCQGGIFCSTRTPLQSANAPWAPSERKKICLMVAQRCSTVARWLLDGCSAVLDGCSTAAQR